MRARLLIIGLIAGAVAYGSTQHMSLQAQQQVTAAGPEDQCWECEYDCSYGGHSDYIDIRGNEYNHHKGGTFHNICNVTTSECWQAHTLCPPIIAVLEGGSEIRAAPMRAADLTSIEVALREGTPSDVRAIMERFAGWVTVDPGSGAVQVRDCKNQVVAHFPTERDVMTVVAD